MSSSNTKSFSVLRPEFAAYKFSPECKTENTAGRLHSNKPTLPQTVLRIWQNAHGRLSPDLQKEFLENPITNQISSYPEFDVRKAVLECKKPYLSDIHRYLQSSSRVKCGVQAKNLKLECDLKKIKEKKRFKATKNRKKYPVLNQSVETKYWNKSQTTRISAGALLPPEKKKPSNISKKNPTQSSSLTARKNRVQTSPVYLCRNWQVHAIAEKCLCSIA
jgi:hypothetical protein